jgi:glycosyltransferase involved in cell wall biosynthesis
MANVSELPPTTTDPISVLLLARDAEPHLEVVLAGWGAQLSALDREYEVLVVDDGSDDRTGALVEEWAARDPRIRLLRHDTPRGHGAALRTSLAAARYPLLLTSTCDRQYQPEDLPRLLGEMDKVHLATGYRVWQPVPWPLRWLGWVWRAVARIVLAQSLEPLPGWLGWRGIAESVRARLLFALRVRDVSCPFRLYRRAVFDRIPIQSVGPFAQVEILAKANFLGCMMTEVPVVHRPRPEQEDRQQRRRDCRRVLLHADFGPAVMPTAAHYSQEPPTSAAPALAGGSRLNEDPVNPPQ